MTNIDNERAAFEAFFKKKHGYHPRYRPEHVRESHCPELLYSSFQENIAWEAFQAGLLARAQSDKAVSVEALEEFIAKNAGSCVHPIGAGLLSGLRALIAKETGNG